MRVMRILLTASLALTLGASGALALSGEQTTLTASAASSKRMLRKEDRAACTQLAAEKGVSKRDSAGYVAICMGDRQAARKQSKK